MKNKKLLGIGIVYKNRGKYVLIDGDIYSMKDLAKIKIQAKEDGQALKKKTYVKKVYFSFGDIK